jgi:undecaprenyl-diphosphatase
MNISHSIILGLVEGITEFLPVSSTFHQIFAAKLLGLQQTEFLKLFEVIIQGGAILSVVILYIRELIQDKSLLKMVIISFIPTAVIGFALEKIIKNVFFQTDWLMLTAFLVVGIVFIVLEKRLKSNKIKLNKDIKDLTVKDALIIGLIQSFAVVPGVSRAGAVIIAMIFLRYDRAQSAKYSFILAIPTILAASALELLKSKDILMSNTSNFGLLIVGTIVAFGSSYIGVRWFIEYLKKHSLEVFGWYRLVIGALILLTLGRII